MYVLRETPDGLSLPLMDRRKETSSRETELGDTAMHTPTTDDTIRVGSAGGADGFVGDGAVRVYLLSDTNAEFGDNHVLALHKSA